VAVIPEVGLVGEPRWAASSRVAGRADADEHRGVLRGDLTLFVAGHRLMPVVSVSAGKEAAHGDDPDADDG
jgi:hypothetical protein